MADKKIVDSFIDELEKRLPNIDKDSWSRKGNKYKSYRSNIMLGRKSKYHDSYERKNCILTEVFKSLDDDYTYDPQGDHPKRIEFEWNSIDLIAATGLVKTWKLSAKQGRWTYDIALELENNTNEFQLTIRSLFTVQATTYISIFFTDKPMEKIKIDTCDGTSIPFSGWTPHSLLRGTNIRLYPNSHSLLVIFLSETEPKIVCTNFYDLSDEKGITV